MKIEALRTKAAFPEYYNERRVLIHIQTIILYVEKNIFSRHKRYQNSIELLNYRLVGRSRFLISCHASSTYKFSLTVSANYGKNSFAVVKLFCNDCSKYILAPYQHLSSSQSVHRFSCI